MRLTPLKQLRKSKGLSQQALADLAGVNIRQIQKYESGEYNPNNMTLKNAVSIADALENADIRDLLKREG